ncbi:hypothetical protein EYF80_031253 [Liparis tanakae]|uniref:Uncharacterized protein n=1 Tax=Liparis tanakae TaxID=230148 RepID=A0A4Z2GZ11_9TELE|nr:hypothetical protein EYF80_031253 [Liparis tanakae]
MWQVAGGRWQVSYLPWNVAECLVVEHTASPPPALQSSSLSGLTFDPPIDLSVDPHIDLSIGLVWVGGAVGVPQGEGLVEAPGGVLQLSVLGGGQLRRAGGQLWGAGGQQVGVWVWLNGRRRGLALLHREEGPAGLGAGDFDSPLVTVGWRGSERLGGGAVEEQLVLRCDWMPAVGLLQVQLLLFPPNVVQQDVAVRRPLVPRPPAPLPLVPCPPAPLPLVPRPPAPLLPAPLLPAPLPPAAGLSVTRPRLSLRQRLGAPERSGGVRSPRPHSPPMRPRLVLEEGDAVQEAVDHDPAPPRWACIRWAGGGGGVLGAGGWRMEGEGLEGLKSLWQVRPERDKGHHHGHNEKQSEYLMCRELLLVLFWKRTTGDPLETSRGRDPPSSGNRQGDNRQRDNRQPTDTKTADRETTYTDTSQFSQSCAQQRLQAPPSLLQLCHSLLVLPFWTVDGRLGDVKVTSHMQQVRGRSHSQKKQTAEALQESNSSCGAVRAVQSESSTLLSGSSRVQF